MKLENTPVQEWLDREATVTETKQFSEIAPGQAFTWKGNTYKKAEPHGPTPAPALRKGDGDYWMWWHVPDNAECTVRVVKTAQQTFYCVKPGERFMFHGTEMLRIHPVPGANENAVSMVTGQAFILAWHVPIEGAPRDVELRRQAERQTERIRKWWLETQEEVKQLKQERAQLQQENARLRALIGGAP